MLFLLGILSSASSSSWISIFVSEFSSLLFRFSLIFSLILSSWNRNSFGGGNKDRLIIEFSQHLKHNLNQLKPQNISTNKFQDYLELVQLLKWENILILRPVSLGVLSLWRPQKSRFIIGARRERRRRRGRRACGVRRRRCKQRPPWRK